MLSAIRQGVRRTLMLSARYRTHFRDMHGCKGKPHLIPFGPEPVYVPFGAEFQHINTT